MIASKSSSFVSSEKYLREHSPRFAEPIVTRRQLLQRTGMGMGWLALAGMLGEEGRAADAEAAAQFAPKQPHFPAKAKRVIHIFAYGGPSQVDTWDPKPALVKFDGKPLDGKRNLGYASPFKFRKAGKSGIEISEVFPKLAEHVDKMTVFRSMWTNVPAHEVAARFLFTGSALLPRPSFGSWAAYGLGYENANLPAFITLNTPFPEWRRAGFLPGVTQGVNVNYRPGMQVKDILLNIKNEFTPLEVQRTQLDLVHQLNDLHSVELQRDPQLETRIESFEMAFKMQTEAPEAFNIGREPANIKELYGAKGLGPQLLVARRLVERGVRFVQVHAGGWDHHAGLEAGLRSRAEDLDGPAAALLTDLQAKGLLDETLVVWCGEIGRTVTCDLNSLAREPGRDHNGRAICGWMAGGGVKQGFVYGATDELGAEAVESRMHTHDFQATILALLGFDHERLTYRYNGRDFRLTDNDGKVANGIIA